MHALARLGRRRAAGTVIMPASMAALHSTPQRAARVLLACFALVLLVAGLGPLTLSHPLLERVCSAAGEVRWAPTAIQGANDAAPNASGHALECALCLPPLAAPPAPVLLAAHRHTFVPPLIRTALRRPHAPLSRAPFPPRAPPLPAAA